MSNDDFTKLFQYLEQFRSEVESKFEEAKKERDQIRGDVAELGAQIRDYHQELLMLSNKVERLERWIQQIAQETGVKLDFGKL